MLTVGGGDFRIFGYRQGLLDDGAGDEQDHREHSGKDGAIYEEMGETHAGPQKEKESVLF